MKPYYYVYRYGHGGPTAIHKTVESAQKEAERLAEQHPESSFDILKCVAQTRATKAKTFWMDGEEPEELTRLAPPTQKFQHHNGNKFVSANAPF
jgi:hypothetical protein